MSINLQRARELFLHAVGKLSPDQWEDYIAEASGGDDELQRQVRQLLQVHREAGSFLEQPAVAIVNPSPTLDQPITEKPGSQIGPYKLLQQLGEGGMGVVYMAEQKEPVKRRVALKIIKPGMDTRHVIARFEAERQALAMMDHPNIAKVLDAGATESGRPYFVMELVKGLPVTRYCDEQHLTPKERLELFVPICRAVQHAHQKGIIHRDLKPSNILLALYDGRPVPKVIDFGVAKATGGRLNEKTMFTDLGQIIGTIEYMSPEQAERNQLDIDTRSDVYSLGVVLYELLTGDTPFDKQRLRSAAIDELLRIIREEEPPKPSTKLSYSDTLPRVAANRQIEPAKLGSLVRGELDWIVMKALEKDRGRRYETASAFAEDVERYLQDQPVQACPPSIRYRFTKFARRNSGILSIVLLFGIMLFVGTTLSIWLAVRETNARMEAARATAQATGRAEQLRRKSYFQLMTLAHADYEANRIRRMVRLLEDCPSDLRGWEWYYLSHIFDQSVRTFAGHADRVTAVAFAPDQTWIATASWDHTVRVFDVATGTNIFVLHGHTGHVNSVAISPDGLNVASASADGTIRTWSRQGVQSALTIQAHREGVDCVAYSPDGRWLASSGGDEHVCLWNADTGRNALTLSGHLGAVFAVAFSPDSRRVLSAGEDGTIRLWEIETGEAQHVLVGHLGAVHAVSFSPDGAWIISGGRDNTLRIWDPVTGTAIRTIWGHTHWIGGVAVSPDSRRIASACADSTVRIWDVDTGRQIGLLRGHRGPCVAVTYSPDGRWILSGSWWNTSRLWNADVPVEPSLLVGHSDMVKDLAVSPGGDRIVSASADGTVRMWDVIARTETHCLRGHAGAVNCVAVSPDGRTIFSAGDDETVRLWQAATGEQTDVLRGHKGPVLALAISPDGQTLASGGADRTVVIWEVDSSTPQKTLVGHAAAVSCVAFSPVGSRLVSGSDDATLRIWNLPSGKPGHVLLGHSGQVTSVAFSPDGRQILSACQWNREEKPGELKTWDVRSGRQLLTIDSAGPRRTAAYSPRGLRIVAGGADATIMIWDAATGEEALTLRQLDAEIVDVLFSSDGRQIIAAGLDHAIRIWEADTIPDTS